MAGDPNLGGKVALVTGASRGIGLDIARVLAREGMTVICAARTENEGDSRIPGGLSTTVDAINEAGGKAVAHRVDLAREEDIQALWEWSVGEFGHVDAVVNNAGILAPGTIEHMNQRHFGLVFQINVAGPDGRSADLAAMRQSSRNCLKMRQPANAAGLMVSAPGQSLPNEFHVFINEFYGADLYVATEAGLWKVSAGLVIRQQ